MIYRYREKEKGTEKEKERGERVQQGNKIDKYEIKKERRRKINRERNINLKIKRLRQEKKKESERKRQREIERVGKRNIRKQTTRNDKLEVFVIELLVIIFKNKIINYKAWPVPSSRKSSHHLVCGLPIFLLPSGL